MSRDRPLLGIALVLAFCAIVPMGDAIAKLLGGRVALPHLLLARFGLQAALLAPLVVWLGLSWRIGRDLWPLVVLRALLHIAGIGAMYAALVHLPLADAVAIAFVMPFLLLLLGNLLLGEAVGWRRLAACCAGFAGTLLVLQPRFAEVGAPALLPLLVALAFALFMLVTRRLAPRTDPVSLQAVSGAVAVVAILPAALLAPPPVLAAIDWGLLFAMGALGTAAHLALTWSLRFAPAATLAPIQYLEIPFAAVIGLLVFGDWPGPMALAGIALSVAAGLYIIARERAIAQAPQQAPPTPPPAPPAA